MIKLMILDNMNENGLKLCGSYVGVMWAKNLPDSYLFLGFANLLFVRGWNTFAEYKNGQ